MNESLNPDELRNKTLGCLFGVFIGDAFGLPLKGMPPKEICENFGYVDEYIKNEDHQIEAVRNRAAGTVSDISQLTLALMDSLTRQEGYDFADIQQAHIEAYDKKWGQRTDWDANTLAATRNLKEGKTPTCMLLGETNTPVSKIAPLGIYSVYKIFNMTQKRFTDVFNESLLNKCKEITEITHGNPRCIVAAYCQARMIIRAMQSEIPTEATEIVRVFLSDASYAEEILEMDWSENALSDSIEALLSSSDIFDRTTFLAMNDIYIDGTTVCNSYTFVIYCVAKYLQYKNIRYTLTETANAGGESSDHTSMVGAILGAHMGFHAFATDMLRPLVRYRLFLQEIRKFEQSL